MKIYTSYFGNAKALAKEDIKIVSVARWQPRFMSVPVVMYDVAPTPWMVKQATREQYVDAYRQILSELDAQEFISRLENMSGGADVALCCYEKPGDFCHRHMLAQYLTERTGIQIMEFALAPKTSEPTQKKNEQPSLFDDF